MGRKKAKKAKKEKVKYLPGADWRDVLAGKPVTAADREASDRRKGRSPARCLSCRAVGMMRSTIDPCMKCGGRLEQIN